MGGKNSILPELTDKQKEDRVDFCKNMTSNEGEKIYETFYSV